jgi:hypothetical protein
MSHEQMSVDSYIGVQVFFNMTLFGRVNLRKCQDLLAVKMVAPNSFETSVTLDA